ncbi:Kinesin-like protein Klp98A [Amphibalanus amphitrite]|uniref:Kinesin-like protein Klp98A n=1 Tax=Amphibalanus amphitrite TaxID=1232801 RepID=A0A6A4W9R2_AMPAM|nr:Kinesin-like protein Klp98A [Amphibalanus amphitrite]
MTNQWMEGWRETQKILQEQQTLGLRKSGVGVVLDSDRPHLIGIDDDLTSTGITLYQLKIGSSRVWSVRVAFRWDGRPANHGQSVGQADMSAAPGTCSEPPGPPHPLGRNS